MWFRSSAYPETAAGAFAMPAMAREQALRSAAEEANRRSAFLAGASTKLAESLDPRATREALLRVVVPVLADAAGVTLLDDRGQPESRELAWRFPPDPTVHTALRPVGESADDVDKARARVLAGGPAVGAAAGRRAKVRRDLQGSLPKT